MVEKKGQDRRSDPVAVTGDAESVPACAGSG